MKIRHQKGQRGVVRERLSPRVEQEVKRSIKATAREYHCSMPFVANVLLAKAYGLSVESYEIDQRRRLRRVK